jgi:hypothetical protein
MSENETGISNMEDFNIKIACPVTSNSQKTSYGMETTTSYEVQSVSIPFERPDEGTLTRIFKCPRCGMENSLKIKNEKANKSRKSIGCLAYVLSVILLPVFLVIKENHRINNGFLLGLLSFGIVVTVSMLFVGFVPAIYFNFNFMAKRGLSIKIAAGHKIVKGNFLVSAPVKR